MADGMASALPDSAVDLGAVRLVDESYLDKWRTWKEPFAVPLGSARRTDAGLVLSVAPGEWLVIGGRPDDEEAVDITHVRAAIRLAGAGTRTLLEQVCALDLSDAMTPDGAAARGLVAGVATEIVRDDVDGGPSYLLLVSRSFAYSVWGRLVEAAENISRGPAET